MLINKTKVYKFKAKYKVNCYKFWLESVSKDFTKYEQSKISLNGSAYYFSVDHNLIKKEAILNTHQYLLLI